MSVFLYWTFLDFFLAILFITHLYRIHSLPRFMATTFTLFAITILLSLLCVFNTAGSLEAKTISASVIRLLVTAFCQLCQWWDWHQKCLLGKGRWVALGLLWGYQGLFCAFQLASLIPLATSFLYIGYSLSMAVGAVGWALLFSFDINPPTPGRSRTRSTKAYTRAPLLGAMFSGFLISCIQIGTVIAVDDDLQRHVYFWGNGIDLLVFLVWNHCWDSYEHEDNGSTISSEDDDRDWGNWFNDDPSSPVSILQPQNIHIQNPTYGRDVEVWPFDGSRRI